ncbi:MAG TPA: tetratricopeptide repeat protein [Anaeromyxobacteraceae bacterium]|nr:tetratricopeptide repeat protein [Anaeromyxobacteraceae bacterium]
MEPRTSTARPGGAGDPLRPWRAAGLAATAAIVLAAPLYLAVHAGRGPRSAPPGEPQFVGSERCKACHQKAYDAWKGSHHAKAMQAARDDTVLGDFGGATFLHRGKTWRFFRQGERFMVHAEGPDGALRDYEVAYTFGLEPLQQYLVVFPGGRLQCLSAAWDTRARRWFYVNPGPDAPPGDWLHWTRPGQSWNAMCADCHSTAVRKRYDPEKDAYRTTWSEIMVGCEACHGPGSRHAAWAAQPAMGRAPVENAALVTRTSRLAGPELVALCAPCHARRSQFADQGVPGGELLDRYLPVLLTPGTFHPDGQILDEDFEWHSFTQSKMYASGVRCSDCHDVHSGKRHAEGNALCTRCHRADTYDAASHHFHKQEWRGRASAGVLCVSCHMPGRNFMVVHFRRDHSMRVPRPDLTAALGVPNACSAAGCHADRPASWVQERYDGWYGKKRKPHYGTILADGRRSPAAAEAELIRLAQDQLRPVVARATAVELLAGAPGPAARTALEKALSDPEPLVRATAARRLPVEEPGALARLLGPLLQDPVRAVRSEAAARLAGAPSLRLTEAQRKVQGAALDEYVEGQRYMSDLPSGPYDLGNLDVALGHPAEAERQYRRALEIDDQLYMAKANLATLLAGAGRLEEAEKLLREAHAQQPGQASISFNLGLLLAEAGKRAEAESLLRAALAADPAMAAAAFNLAVLVGEKRPAEAVPPARKAATLRPEEPRYAWTLAFYQARSGNLRGAAETLEALLKAHPDQGDAYGLLAEVYARQGRTAEAQALIRRRPASQQR